MKASDAPAATALETPSLYSTSVTVDSDKPMGLPACKFLPPHTNPATHNTEKLKHSVDNSGEVGPIAVYLPS